MAPSNLATRLANMLPEKRRFALQDLPSHLLAAGIWDKLEQLLTDLGFLEAKTEAGLVLTLAEDFAEATKRIPPHRPQHRMLRLLEAAIRRDLHFIARHPTTLFQCLWNSCWWYDCPEAELHYVEAKEGLAREPSQEPPWRRAGPHLHQLLEAWRTTKEHHQPGFIWVRSLRPPPISLGSPWRGILSGHTCMVGCIAFSRDGRCMVTVSGDSQTPYIVRVWNATTGQELGVLPGQPGFRIRAALSPNGTQVAVGGDAVQLWDCASWDRIGVLEGEDTTVCAVAFSPDGQWIATGSYDGTPRLWDARTLTLARTLGRHGAAVELVVFSPDGRYLATAGARAIVLWDCESGSRIHVIRASDEIRAMAFSSEGTRLIFGRDDGLVALYAVPSGEWLRYIEAHRHSVVGISFADHDRVIVTAAWSEPQPVRIWDSADASLLRSFSCGESSPTSLGVSPDGDTIVVGSHAGPLWLWSAAGGSQPPELRGHGKVGTVVFSPDGTKVISGGDSNSLRVWDTDSSMLLSTMAGMGYASFLGCSEDGRYFATRSTSGVSIWDCATVKEVAVLDIPGEGIDRIAFSPDGRVVATCFREDQQHFSPSVVTTWRASRALDKKIVEFRAHANNIRGVAFLRDGQTLVTLSADGLMCKWDGSSGRILFRRNIGQDTVHTVLSPERDVMVCVGFFGSSVRLWDLRTGHELPELRGLQLPVRDVRFEPDGQNLVTRSEGGTTQVWDVWAGQCVRTSGDSSLLQGEHYTMEEGNVALGETLIRDRRSGEAVAWFPVALWAQSDGIRPRWYGHEGTFTRDGGDLYGLVLEGGSRVVMA